jgi:hypothetical protein
LGTIESTSPSGHSLRLVLVQIADRVTHRIEVLDSDARVMAELRSIEGTGIDEWPPSPALQSCSLQEIHPGQTTAFLVGMAGKSHWSASLEPVAGQGEFIFDIACRVQGSPAWIGSTYELPKGEFDGSALFFPGNAQAALSCPGARLWILPEIAGAGGISRCEPLTENRLQILGPIEPVSPHRTSTLRWRYRLRLQATPSSPL